MLRLVLLVLYLVASSSTSPHTKNGSGWDPLGLNVSPPHTDGGSGADPLGLNAPPTGTDGGGGADPMG